MDLVIDFETLGTDPSKSAVLDMSCFIFDWGRFTTRPYSFMEIVNACSYYKFDVKHQVQEHGYVVSKSTLDFWKKQSKEVRALIKPSAEDITVEDFTNKFINYLPNNIDYWWSRSNTFDPPFLWRLFNSVKRVDDLNKKLPYYKVRDIRTYIDAKFDFNNKMNGFIPIADVDYWKSNIAEHSSRHDVAADVMRFQSITRAMNDLEQVTR